jgi:hypothetical protein
MRRACRRGQVCGIRCGCWSSDDIACPGSGSLDLSRPTIEHSANPPACEYFEHGHSSKWIQNISRWRGGAQAGRENGECYAGEGAWEIWELSCITTRPDLRPAKKKVSPLPYNFPGTGPLFDFSARCGDFFSRPGRSRSPRARVRVTLRNIIITSNALDMT